MPSVIVSPDRATAEVQLDPGPPASLEDVRTALTAAGVRHGIDDAAVASLQAPLADPTARVRTVVARATPPVRGEDGALRLPFAIGPLPGFRSGNGSIDYRERGMLHPAATGAVVGELAAPTFGTPGVDVTGAAIAAVPGSPAALQTGPGAVVRADGTITATRSGVVVWHQNRLDVVPLYEHKGDVDLRSGNLHTHGSLRIDGDVHEGFRVDADEDVVVRGAVLDATVAAGGSVVVEQGVLGTASAVTAGADLECRHGNGAALRAGGVLRAAQTLVHCRASAWRIELLQGRGQVVGGETRARERIAVLRAGTEAGAPTLLAVADLAGEQDELVRRSAAAAKLERRVVKQTAQRGDAARSGKWTRRHVAAADAAQQERLELLRRQRELLRDARIEVREELHEGVRIRLGTATTTIQKTCRNASFRWDAQGGAIVQEHP